MTHKINGLAVVDWIEKRWKVLSALAAGIVAGALWFNTAAIWVAAADQGHRSRDQILDQLTTIVNEQQKERKKRKTKKEDMQELCTNGRIEGGHDAEECQWARQPD